MWDENDEKRKDKLTRFLDQADILLDLYSKFVYTMERDLIENLLIKYRLVNEGELFCSDFTFRFSDNKSRDFIGFLGKSNEETVNEIKQELQLIIQKYSKGFKDYVSTLSASRHKELEETRL